MAERGPAVVLDGQEVPAAWRVGDFELEVAELTAGRLDKQTGLFRGVAGKAWLRLPCARPPVRTPWRVERPTAVGPDPRGRGRRRCEAPPDRDHPRRGAGAAAGRRCRRHDRDEHVRRSRRAPGDRFARPWQLELDRGEPARGRVPRRVQQADGPRRGGRVAGPRGRWIGRLSGRRAVPQADRDRDRRLRRRDLLARALATPLDGGRRGAAAGRADGRRLVPAGHDRSRGDPDVAPVRLLPRRAGRGLWPVAAGRHRHGHRGHRLRARPEHGDESPRRGRRRGADWRSAPERRPARSTSRIRATPATCAATTPTPMRSWSVPASSGALELAEPVTFGAINPLGQTLHVPTTARSTSGTARSSAAS